MHLFLHWKSVLQSPGIFSTTSPRVVSAMTLFWGSCHSLTMSSSPLTLPSTQIRWSTSVNKDENHSSNFSVVQIFWQQIHPGRGPDNQQDTFQLWRIPWKATKGWESVCLLNCHVCKVNLFQEKILQRAQQHTSASAMNKLPPSYRLAIIMLMAGHTINLSLWPACC